MAEWSKAADSSSAHRMMARVRIPSVSRLYFLLGFDKIFADLAAPRGLIFAARALVELTETVAAEHYFPL